MQRLWQPRRWATRHPIHQIVRHAGRKTWRGKDPKLGNPEVSAYSINRLVLDLDAEHVEHVRQYDPDIDGLPEDRLAKRERRDAAADARIDEFYTTAQEEADAFKRMRLDRAFQWHINDLDIISTVLRGLPADGSATRDLSSPTANNISQEGLYTQTVTDTLHGINAEGIRRNGIPKPVQKSSSRLISCMLHRQKQTQEYYDRRMQAFANGMSEEFMTDVVWKSNSIEELKRSLFFLVNTAYGNELVFKQNQKLGDTCFKIIENGEAAIELDEDSALGMLQLCNDLVLDLLQKGLPIKHQLWCLGLDLAVRCSAFPAAQIHLEAGLKFGEDLHGQNFLSEPLKTILDSIKPPRHGHEPLAPSSSPSGHHAAIFGLLTGQDLSGHHSPISIQSMIEYIQPSDPAIYQSFIHILGELGALRTLWHFFQQAPRILQNSNDGSGRVGNGLEEIHDHFAKAFLETARRVQNGQISIESMKLAEAMNNVEGDCRLDLETIFISFKSDSVSSANLSPLPVDAIPSEMKEIKEAFGMSDIAVSMQALEALLLRLGRERTRG